MGISQALSAHSPASVHDWLSVTIGHARAPADRAATGCAPRRPATADVFRRRVLADAVAEVEHVAVPARRRCRRRPAPTRLRRGSRSGAANSTAGIEVALQRHAVRRRGARAAPRLTVQSRPSDIGADVGDLLQPQAAALGEDDARDRARRRARASAARAPARVGQAETAGRRRRPARRPSCRRSSPPARRRRSAR